jgi:proline iminopeptidase
MQRFLTVIILCCLLNACTQPATVDNNNYTADVHVTDYFNYGDSGVRSAGIKMIPVTTPAGVFKVWTKRIGNNPRIKVLLLHGGPAGTHEYMESFESFFPKEGFEFYEYDQLGSYYSDQPADSSLWTTDRFVEEVEQVRKAIGADSTNFYLLGNSWGGILAMEYALKYQVNLKGLIVANMMASCPAYGKYAAEKLAPQMDASVLDSIRMLERKKDFNNPRYMALLMEHFYKKHFCRLEEWPEPVNRFLKHLNQSIYVLMQGPSEFGIAGRLANWDVTDQLKNIRVPTLMIGAKYDTMDPNAMEEQSKKVQRGRYLFCPDGSHLSMWDDQQHFFPGVIQFIKDVDQGKF